ncbi:MAG: DUF481 domain-containing protein [Candidatus Saelkia tenebricola]|nr:DUF481 domain-containing protein [Candidatus Saelkia tenebricola]
MTQLQIILRILLIYFGVILFLNSNLFCDEVYLKNGDRLTGEIIRKDANALTLDSETIGKIDIERKHIERVVSSVITEKEKPLLVDKKIVWERNFSLGYNLSRGNTDSSQLSSSFFINRKREHIDEYTLRSDLYYSSSNKEMDGQKWSNLFRYAYSFGSEKRWYSFYKLEANHDRFANIDYRLIPAFGAGYWLYDEPKFKITTEVAFGFEYSNYRDQTDSSSNAILIPRIFLEKEFLNKSRIVEDLYFYPSLNDEGDFRIYSETKFINPLTEKLFFKTSIIDEYYSDPVDGVKNNDLRLIFSLGYSF